MSIETQDLESIITAINQSGGLPISMQSVVQTDPLQFWVMVILTAIGSLFILLYAWELYGKDVVSDIYLRFVLRNWTKHNGRHFIFIKHTRDELFNQSMINSHTLIGIEKAILSFKGEPFDIILHTPGGSVFFGQLLSKIIRSKGDVRCFIPYYAMSGGTFLALSCKEIFLGGVACLGPIDPQLGSLFGYGSAKSWNEVIRIKRRRASDTAIQMAFTGKQYTESIKRDIYLLLSDKISDDAKRECAADYLTNGCVEHGKQLMGTDLENLGIPVKEIPKEIQEMLSKAISSPFIEGVYWK